MQKIYGNPLLISIFKKAGILRGSWVAQSVERPTLDFSSGRDLMFHEFEPHIGYHTNSSEPGVCSHSLSLSLSLSLSALLVHCLSLSQK